MIIGPQKEPTQWIWNSKSSSGDWINKETKVSQVFKLLEYDVKYKSDSVFTTNLNWR